MEMSDVRKFVVGLTVKYPTYKLDYPLEFIVNAWYEDLKEYTTEQVIKAYEFYKENNSTGFAPSVDQIINNIHTMNELVSGEYLPGIQAWGIVRNAIGDAIYHAQEKYDKLPHIIKKTVGSPNVLKMWAQTDLKELETVIQSNFIKSYDINVKNEKLINRMPTEIKNQIEQKNQELLESHV